MLKAPTDMVNSPINQVAMHSMPMEDFDKLSMKLAILHANLELIYGEGFENFETYSDNLKDVYLWGCATLASEALDLIKSKSAEVSHV
jgi:hypothetical protein